MREELYFTNYVIKTPPAIEPITHILENEVKVFLKNVGLGPAKVLEYVLMLDNKKISHNDLLTYFDDKFNFNKIEHDLILPPCIFQVNAEMILISCNPHLTIGERNEIFRALGKVSIKIVYVSMYKSKITDTLQFTIS